MIGKKKPAGLDLSVRLPGEVSEAIDAVKSAEAELQSAKKSAAGLHRIEEEARLRLEQAEADLHKATADHEIDPNSQRNTARLEEARTRLTEARLSTGSRDARRRAYAELIEEKRKALSAAHDTLKQQFAEFADPIRQLIDLELTGIAQRLVDLRKIAAAISWDPDIFVALPPVKIRTLSSRRDETAYCDPSPETVHFANDETLLDATSVLQSGFRQITRS